MIEQTIENAVQRAFFETYFPTLRAVRYGIWMVTAFGNQRVDKHLVRDAGFVESATMFDYADALVRYADGQGWSQELAKLLEEDIRDVFLNGVQAQVPYQPDHNSTGDSTRNTTRYFRSRNFQGASVGYKEETLDA